MQSVTGGPVSLAWYGPVVDLLSEQDGASSCVLSIRRCRNTPVLYISGVLRGRPCACREGFAM